jgi:hypothetical protein
MKPRMAPVPPNKALAVFRTIKHLGMVVTVPCVDELEAGVQKSC